MRSISHRLKYIARKNINVFKTKVIIPKSFFNRTS